MKLSEKYALADRLALAMRDRFKAYEIGNFLNGFGVSAPQNLDPMNSKYVYAKAALQLASVETLLRIAQDLDLETDAKAASIHAPPENWRGSPLFKLFVSHISADKGTAGSLKVCLLEHGISAFVAHDDIFPTYEWQEEIERALFTMDAFLALHAPSFSLSNWTQQEIGFALGRGVKVISLKLGEDPTGFLARQQALPGQGRTTEQLGLAVYGLLMADARTRDQLTSARVATGIDLNSELPF